MSASSDPNVAAYPPDWIRNRLYGVVFVAEGLWSILTGRYDNWYLKVAAWEIKRKADRG